MPILFRNPIPQNAGDLVPLASLLHVWNRLVRMELFYGNSLR